MVSIKKSPPGEKMTICCCSYCVCACVCVEGWGGVSVLSPCFVIVVLNVLSSVAIVLLGKRELVS